MAPIEPFRVWRCGRIVQRLSGNIDLAVGVRKDHPLTGGYPQTGQVDT